MARARTRADDGELGWIAYAFNEGDAAKLLCMTQQQVRTLIASGRLPAKIVEDGYVIRRADLINFQFDTANDDDSGDPDQKQKRGSASGTVYVIGFGPYVKIGYTSGALKSRIAGIQTGSPEKLCVFGQLTGGVDLEYALHLRFSELSTYGEWFRREGPLAEWIEAGCPMEAADD